jgi:hypothetical protein
MINSQWIDCWSSTRELAARPLPVDWHLDLSQWIGCKTSPRGLATRPLSPSGLAARPLPPSGLAARPCIRKLFHRCLVCDLQSSRSTNLHEVKEVVTSIIQEDQPSWSQRGRHFSHSEAPTFIKSKSLSLQSFRSTNLYEVKEFVTSGQGMLFSTSSYQ